MFKLKLIGIDKIKKDILEAVTDQFHEYMRAEIFSLEKVVQKKFYNFCLASDIVQELIDGDISGELGLPRYEGGVYVYDVCKKASEKLVFDYFITSKGGESDLYFREGWQAELLSSYPIIISETAKAEVKWLHWLLEEGSNIIIKTHFFLEKDGLGRSHKGIMSKKYSWRVTDPKFAGTLEDNFLTRLLREFAKELKPIYAQYLQDF